MPIEFFFALSTLLVAPFWLLMIGLPGVGFTRAIMRGPWALLPLPLLYAVFLVGNWPLSLYLVEHPTLAGLAAVLTHPAGVLIAWLHILALDLFAGRWIYLDSQERGIPALAVVPVLWLTLLIGPIGLLLYLLLRPFAGPAEAAEASGKPPTPAAVTPPPATGIKAGKTL